MPSSGCLPTRAPSTPASSTWSRTERLVLQAASEPYAHLVGEIALERGEGLAWWAAEHKEPAWIRDELLDDPRIKYVPELEEERFQSLVSVPIVGKDGNVIGVISHPHGGAARVHGGRGRVPRLERLARRRRDRERPPLRGDAPSASTSSST